MHSAADRHNLASRRVGFISAFFVQSGSELLGVDIRKFGAFLKLLDSAMLVGSAAIDRFYSNSNDPNSAIAKRRPSK
jgi:hypothetical protein